MYLILNHNMSVLFMAPLRINASKIIDRVQNKETIIKWNKDVEIKQKLELALHEADI